MPPSAGSSGGGAAGSGVRTVKGFFANITSWGLKESKARNFIEAGGLGAYDFGGLAERRLPRAELRRLEKTMGGVWLPGQRGCSDTDGQV